MKKILSLLVLFPLMAIGQTQTENYIKTTTYKVPTSTSITTPAITQANQNITYFDGLGRPIQQIAYQQSGSGKDIVTPIEYDDFGRQPVDYLPYVPNASASLDYKSTALTDVGTFYNTAAYENTLNPFSEKLLEASPLNRVLKQAAPGTDWALNTGHEIKLEYQTNTSPDAVKLFSVTASWDAAKGLYDIPTSLTPTDYLEFQLYKNITFDENTAATPIESDGSTVEFKNKEGQVVLKRTYESGIKHDTYYVYDQYGNLTFVIPPLVDATTTISNTILNDLCYQYKYDYRNRLVEKKLPGKQWEFIVYDKLDRVVATGPALSPFSNMSGYGWLITKYDVYNRSILTAWQPATVTSGTRTIAQTAQSSASTISETKSDTATDIMVNGVAFRYTNAVTPTTGYYILTINYYDDYNFPYNTWTMPNTVLNQPVYYNNTNKPKGLPTGSWTRILTVHNQYLNERNYVLYDSKARVIKNYTTTFLGGSNSTYTKYDFMGKILYTENYHKRQSTSVELKTTDVFTYTNQDRLATHLHQINTDAPQLIAANTYDELGQLISKNVGGLTGGGGFQKVDYAYNIRGWLTEINKVAALQQGSEPKDLFGFKINYNTIDGDPTVTNKLYNGNIAETSWSSSPVVRTYGYKYDNLNRLLFATYQKLGITPELTQVTRMYDENQTYDKNGNIKTLNRNGDYDAQMGTMPIDILSYNYVANSNKLMSVSDTPASATSGFKDGNTTGDDYMYDANGNMTIDRNKGITTPILYNHLNLPTKIIFPTGNITYIYNATGQKVQKTVTEGTTITTTYYLGGYQYNNTILMFFPIAEGYVEPSGSSYKYVYQYKDYLGNIRLSYAKNATTGVLEIIEENNYYPFGLKHKGYNEYTPTNNKYKYNGKELEDELGKNTYAYGWRDYDPVIGRFNKIDRFAEKYYNLSTYSYAGNNPILFVDVQGDSISVGSVKRAERMERRATKKADRLEQRANSRQAKGKNIGDMRDRVAELRQSSQDIRDMRNDPNTWYSFEKVNSSNNPLRDTNDNGLPVTLRTGTNEITMFMPSFNNMHEPRHGGQIARGGYDIIGIGLAGIPTSTYGAQEEISAYRAQYASSSGMKPYGSLTYLPSFTPSQADALMLVSRQATMRDIYRNYQQTVTNINNINSNLLTNMYDTNGINQNPIYLNNPTIWWNN